MRIFKYRRLYKSDWYNFVFVVLVHLFLMFVAILDVSFIVGSQEDYTCFAVLGDFLFADKMDQRICIKFCLKNGIKCSTAFEILTVAFGKSTMSKARVVYEWYKCFKKRPLKMTIECEGSSHCFFRFQWRSAP